MNRDDFNYDDPSNPTDPTDPNNNNNNNPPPSNQSSPVGFLDSVDSGLIRGWSYDPDNPSVSNDVHLYIGGPAGSGAAGFAVTANQSRPDVNQVMGVAGDHGFSFPIPPQFANGQTYAVYAYGIDTGANSPRLLNDSPRYFSINPIGELSLNQVSPLAGALVGGLSVMLNGSGFLSGAEVYFGSTLATDINVESSEVIRVTTPEAAAPGSVAVTVVNPDGGTVALEGGFTYISTYDCSYFG